MNSTYKINGMPVIHLEFLSKDELKTAKQILQAFDFVGIPFVSIAKSLKKQELILHSHNVKDVQELHNIATELKQIIN